MTTAVNCCCVRFAGHALPVSLAYRLTVVLGLTVTLIGGGGGGGAELPPPQATSNASSTNKTHIPAMAERRETLFPAIPTMMMPAIGSVSGSHGDRLSARCDLLVPVPVFGPLVVIVTATAVGPDPAAIFVGSVCPVLTTQATVESGRLEQPNVTSVVNVPDGEGVAVKL